MVIIDELISSCNVRVYYRKRHRKEYGAYSTSVLLFVLVHGQLLLKLVTAMLFNRSRWVIGVFVPEGLGYTVSIAGWLRSFRLGMLVLSRVRQAPARLSIVAVVVDW